MINQSNISNHIKADGKLSILNNDIDSLCHSKFINAIEAIQEIFNQDKDKYDIKDFKEKYNFIKSHKKKENILSTCIPFDYYLAHPKFKEYLFEDDINYQIIPYLSNKIRMIHKHTQTMKTEICNRYIISEIANENSIIIALTRNDLESQNQWVTRLIKDLKRTYQNQSTKNHIIIFSSKKNNLNGDATHCSNRNQVLELIKHKNTFKIIFMCSNNNRYKDLEEILNDVEDSIKMRNMRITCIDDEAHNTNTGITAYRCQIEHLLYKPNLEYYIPVTASGNNIYNDNLILWNEYNLLKNFIDYTDIDKTLSSDNDYSSCNNAIAIDLDKLELTESIEIPEELPIKSYAVTYCGKKCLQDLTEEELDNGDRKRRLDYCPFIKRTKEHEAYENIIKALNLNTLYAENLFESDRFNLWVINTPFRNILTDSLQNYALKMNYNPIILAIWGKDKYHLKGKDIDEDSKDIMRIMKNGLEFNEKLFNLLEYLKRKNVNMNRPFIILGNYFPTGESITFVNYKYGIVKGVIKSISTNPEEDYQVASRANYKTNLFEEKNNDWKMPKKYLIGPKEFIENALAYEKKNDQIVMDHLEKKNNNNQERQLFFNKTKSLNTKNNHNSKIPAIPVKIKIIDRDNENVQNIISIAKKPKKNEADKKQILKLLEIILKNDEIECSMHDKTGKFNFNDYIIHEFLTYSNDRKDTSKYPIPTLNNKYEKEIPYIIDTNKKSNEKNYCEICISIDDYRENGKTYFKSDWWICYNYF